ncbi:uncharacterized protein [Littorina saxatilis]|uniref:uncharacterized protein n=1 Tax=Littorina saxatilis TaxID=31220 RepID=UPI0038B50E65
MATGGSPTRRITFETPGSEQPTERDARVRARSVLKRLEVERKEEFERLTRKEERDRQDKKDELDRQERERQAERQAERDRQERKDERDRQDKKEKDELDRQERERQAERDRQEKKDERDRLDRKEQADRDLQLELARLQAEKGTLTQASAPTFVADRTRLPTFDDDKDELDDFLRRFERIASDQKWEEATWASRLSTCLKGRALQLYNALEDDEARDYQALKKALLQRFNLTAEAYRRRLRNSKRLSGELSHQFVARLNLYLRRWVEMAEKDWTVNDLADLIVMEQLMSSLRPEVVTFVQEHQPKTTQEAADWIRVHEDAQAISGKSSGSRPGKTGNSGSSGPKDGKDDQGHKGSSSRTDIQCYYCNKRGHVKKDCHKRQADQKGVHFVGSEEFRDVTSSCTIPQLCVPCSRKHFQPHCNVYVNGVKGEGLRDTGADMIVVRASLVPAMAYTGDSIRVRMAEASHAYDLNTAVIKVVTPLFTGTIVAVVMDDPPCDLLIGNRVQFVDGVTREVPVYRSPDVISVLTRAQAEREDKPLKPLPAARAALGNVTPALLAKAQDSDPTLATPREHAKSGKVKLSGKHGRSKFLRDKKLLYREFSNQEGTFKQVVVPREFREGVMATAHDSILGGHLGTKKTTDRVWRHFYWPGICTDVRRFCASCDKCQKVVAKGRVRKVPLEKMPLIDEPFRRVAVDIIGPILPASEDGNRYILTMVDYATRYPEAIPLKSIEATRVAEALVTMWSRLGIPSEVLTDRGTQFTGGVMAEAARLLSLEQHFTTPYHAQCNGLVERFNGTLKTMLRKLAQEKPRTWDRYIPALLFAYREVPQESLGFSPFELLYGRQVRGPMAILRQAWTDEEADEEVQTTATYIVELRNRIEETCKLAQENLGRAAQRYARGFDRKARPRSFKIGERVLLLLPVKHNKLQLQWQGPFEVTAKVGQNDYRIVMNGKARLYHANLLRAYIERTAYGEKDKVTEAVAVVMDETTEEQGGGRVPVCPLEASEDHTDVHISPELGDDQQADLQEILKDAARVLTDIPLQTHLEEFTFDLLEKQPVRTKQYPMPHAQKEVVRKEIADMTKLGVIEPANSPYSSPIVLVKKKDGRVRFCVDYRKLNKITAFDAEPMPDVDYLFSHLAKAKYFSKLDLTKGYWQIPVAEEDRPKTAFTTPFGQFQWTVMPFGLQNAGAVFTRMMRKLLEPLKREDISSFIDDVLIATETWTEHLDALRDVFGRLKDGNLGAKPSKCYLGFRELSFLGHVVGEGLLVPEDDKIQKIREAEPPRTKKEVRSFLGLASFYRRFIPHFAEIALPLTNLTKKLQPTVVVWTEECSSAFNTLKRRLTSQPILRLPDLNKDFVLRTDASGKGLGAVLLQETEGFLHPVCFASRKLTSAEAAYATVERECLAIVWGIQKFEAYLYGRPFCLETDHQPLQYLQVARLANARLMRWALILQPYQFTVRVIPGANNVGADFLSRAVEENMTVSETEVSS